MMRRNALIAMLLMFCLSACSSTAPTSVTVPDASSAARVEAGKTATVTQVPADGPITASMATLQIGGERYATMGDPAAPLTLVEFSDFG